MDERVELQPDQLDEMAHAFCEQLLACLDECARGRKGLFGDADFAINGRGWPEAERLRELAAALQGVFAQHEQQNALCDEFLDLCSMHGESHPGERRLARDFLDRIERGEVGMKADAEGRPW